MALDFGKLPFESPPLLPPPDDMTTGSMSYLIYNELNQLLSPPLQASMSAEQLDEVRTGWKKLDYAIAKGVIEHLKNNLEVYGIETRGDLTITGNTGTTSDHLHALNLSIPQVSFNQSNEGTGHVK